MGLLFILLLGASWACDARQLGGQLSVLEISKQEVENESRTSGQVAGKDDVCTLCEEFAAEAVDYLSKNTTQSEIINLLHMSCSSFGAFEKQCIALVDYYVPLFFSEITMLQPADFCLKLNLCQHIAAFSSQLQEDSCGLCHRTVSEIITKLKDPDTQMEILELLLKGCNSMESYAVKCKRMVFEYAPIILTNAEQFLETTDVCTILHACKSPAAGADQAVEKVIVLVDS